MFPSERRIMLDSGPKVKCVKPGDKIEVPERYSRDEEAKNYTYTVIRVYPFMVLAERKKHVRRCFSYGDLVVAGLERQEDSIEARRKFMLEGMDGHRGRTTDYSRRG